MGCWWKWCMPFPIEASKMSPTIQALSLMHWLDDFRILKNMEYLSDLAPKLPYSQKTLIRQWSEHKLNMTMAAVVQKLANGDKYYKDAVLFFLFPLLTSSFWGIHKGKSIWQHKCHLIWFNYFIYLTRFIEPICAKNSSRN